MQPSFVPPRYLRTDEAALFLGLSPRTLEKHRTHGTGPLYRKLGGRVVYAVADLQEWADFGTVSSTSDPNSRTVRPAARPSIGQLAEGPRCRLGLRIRRGEVSATFPSWSQTNRRLNRGITPAKGSDIDPAQPPQIPFVQQAVAQSLEPEKSVSVTAYLTLEEVAERYRYKISDGTLRNWRSKRIGPSFIKVGKAILYPIEELERWDRSNLISCSRVSIASFGANNTEGEVD